MNKKASRKPMAQAPRRGLLTKRSRLETLMTAALGGRAPRQRYARRAPPARRLALALGGVIGVTVLVIMTVAFFANRNVSAPPVASQLPPQELLASTNMGQRFDVLRQAHTDYCAHLGNLAAIDAAMAALPKGSYLQGSCCSPMNAQRYQRQVAALKAYASVPQIAADPYNMPASLADRLLHDDQSITLTAAQQAIFDQAARMTDDHGWCCCHCWAWYAHAGLAKDLITRRHFSAAQVVAVTNLEDCCGGA